MTSLPNPIATRKLDYTGPQPGPNDTRRYVHLFFRIVAVASLALIPFLDWPRFMYLQWDYRQLGAPGKMIHDAEVIHFVVDVLGLLGLAIACWILCRWVRRGVGTPGDWTLFTLCVVGLIPLADVAYGLCRIRVASPGINLLGAALLLLIPFEVIIAKLIHDLLDVPRQLLAGEMPERPSGGGLLLRNVALVTLVAFVASMALSPFGPTANRIKSGWQAAILGLLMTYGGLRDPHGIGQGDCKGFVFPACSLGAIANIGFVLSVAYARSRMERYRLVVVLSGVSLVAGISSMAMMLAEGSGIGPGSYLWIAPPAVLGAAAFVMCNASLRQQTITIQPQMALPIALAPTPNHSLTQARSNSPWLPLLGAAEVLTASIALLVIILMVYAAPIDFSDHGTGFLFSIFIFQSVFVALVLGMARLWIRHRQSFRRACLWLIGGWIVVLLCGVTAAYLAGGGSRYLQNLHNKQDDVKRFYKKHPSGFDDAM